ncbi:HEAT repeat domain-containing protein [Candidatus Bipolaricaulota bacterium]|nr:HEAT repeat domain-containing protein [Candidatus Bipolaricaulota bacterium]
MIELLQNFQKGIEPFVVPLVIALAGLLFFMTVFYVLVTLFHVNQRRRLKKKRLSWQKAIRKYRQGSNPKEILGDRDLHAGHRDDLVEELRLSSLPPASKLELYRSFGYYDRDFSELSSKTWWKRGQALNRLKRFPDSGFQNELKSLLYDSSHEVRLVALDALSRLKKVPKLDPIELFESFREELDSFLVIKLLYLKPGMRFIEPLVNSEKQRFRRCGAVLMGQPNKVSFVPVLKKLTVDEKVSVRTKATESLGKIGEKQSIPAMERTSKDKNPAVREATAKSLRKIREEGSLKVLGKLAEDDDFLTRLAAFQSLTYFGEEGREVIGDHWSNNRELAREAIFESYQR